MSIYIFTFWCQSRQQEAGRHAGVGSLICDTATHFSNIIFEWCAVASELSNCAYCICRSSGRHPEGCGKQIRRPAREDLAQCPDDLKLRFLWKAHYAPDEHL